MSEEEEWVEADDCPDCQGTGERYAGYEDVFHQCTRCNGTGIIWSDEQEQV